MSAIGHVTRQQDGSYKGNIDLLTYRGPLDLLVNKTRTGKQPHFRCYSRNTEVGAAWITKNQEGEDYVSLDLHNPAFGPLRIYANLGQAAGQDDPDVFALIWNPKD